jgi:hypothetical protein
VHHARDRRPVTSDLRLYHHPLRSLRPANRGVGPCFRGIDPFWVVPAAVPSVLNSAAPPGDSDSASSFLRFLLNREKRDPGSVSRIYSELLYAIERVSSHQGIYDADANIYGKFEELTVELKGLCTDLDGSEDS